MSRSDVAAVVETVSAATFPRSRAGVRHLMPHAPVRRVASDPRVIAIARRFLGSEPIPFRATLFDKSLQNNWLVAWHQDTALPIVVRRDVPGWGPWSTKAGIAYAHAPAAALSRVIALRIHIDDSRANNGPLRVLPGTHQLGVLTDAEVERLAREIDPVSCEVAAGGIVAMRPLLVHGSSKADTEHPRRVLHVEYVDTVRIAGDLELAIA